MATLTYLRLLLGLEGEGRTIEVSAGAADATKIPNTNANGVLDPTLLNASLVGGAGAAGKIAQLDAATGLLSVTQMPVGIAPDTKSIQASETLASGAFVNLHNVSGAARVRNADNTSGKPAHGFVLAGVASGANALVYFEGTNNQVTGRTIAALQFLGTAGAAVETAPSTATYISQQIGTALSATEISFEPQTPITLA